MDEKELLNASCRVALAGLLHDLGKFAERAGLEVKNLDGNKQTYCPSWEGRHSHLHAAYTGLAIDTIENLLPDIKEGDLAPFSSWHSAREEQRQGNSLINAAAMHHKPETSLQRIVAIADRLASGFERAEATEYNKAEDEREEKSRKINHRQARLWPLLERVEREDKHYQPMTRLPLKAMAPETLYPIPESESRIDDRQARAAYLTLWNQFVEGLTQISQDFRVSLPLWLDHFDSLFLTFTHAIPSATATKKPGGGFLPIPADVSLYDHSKAVAALAVALWRYHEACGGVEAVSLDGAGDNQEFLLIQGDFFGIQEFIFSGNASKFAAKMLRGRSFSVSLLTELAALKVLEVFQLPSTSQIMNAAGKFQIVAPNLPDAEVRIGRLRRELDDWFLKKSFGQAGIGLATTPARREDFDKSRFDKLMERLFKDLERRKRQRFELLCAEHFTAILDVSYPSGACSFCGKAPASAFEEEKGICSLCRDQREVGKNLVQKQRVLITCKPGGSNSLELDYFGYRVTFTGDEARHGMPLRVWDFSQPDQDGGVPLWNGYARRAINGYVPTDDQGDILEFESIAKKGIWEDYDGQGERVQRGKAALGILKGDVDNLGMIFRKGLQQPTFARMASLSRQLNAFFAVWLPWKCAQEFPNTYTVFAGGDDFFLIGPWHEQIRLAQSMREAFQNYTQNENLHFSAGLAMTKPGIPVPALGTLAEEALKNAKDVEGKNAITCWNRSVKWEEFQKLIEGSTTLQELVNEMKEQHRVEMSTAYLYGMLHLCEKAERAKTKPEEALWHSWFVYRTWRFVLDRLRDSDDEKKRKLSDRFARDVGQQIRTYCENYKISLFTYLYRQRKN
ncbi:MAG: type III-A CRISPR-associated protein Cas10/Csm1 [Magnetococcales bacterium]|nr:type III-A CRISPR-associated protein Cas10/Csm1 [Magnetococcales bacterium]